MTSRRESHNAHIAGVDAPHLSRVANNTDSLLSIAYRNGTVAIRHTVSNDEKSYALLIEPIGPVVPFMLQS